MTFRFIIFIFSVIFFSACKTVSIDQESYQVTTNHILLGNIGEGEEYLLEEDYSSTGFVKFEQPIRLDASVLSFSKKTYRLYKEAFKKQNAEFKINYIDSLAEKPKFVQLFIADKISVLEHLNNKQNEKVKDYLKVQPEAEIVTSISFAVNQQKLENLQKAENVFLAKSGYKRYVIKLYEKEELIDQIEMNDGVVFAYGKGSFCWQENSKHQLQIVDIVDGDPCPSNTFKKAKKAKQKLDYFKL